MIWAIRLSSNKPPVMIRAGSLALATPISGTCGASTRRAGSDSRCCGAVPPAAVRALRRQFLTPSQVFFLRTDAASCDSGGVLPAATLQGLFQRRAGPWSGQRTMLPITAHRRVRLASTGADGLSARWRIRSCRAGWRPGWRITRSWTPSRCRPMSSASSAPIWSAESWRTASRGRGVRTVLRNFSSHFRVKAAAYARHAPPNAWQRRRHIWSTR